MLHGETEFHKIEEIAWISQLASEKMKWNPGLSDPNANFPFPVLSDSLKIFISLERESGPRSAEWFESAVFP